MNVVGLHMALSNMSSELAKMEKRMQDVGKQGGERSLAMPEVSDVTSIREDMKKTVSDLEKMGKRLDDVTYEVNMAKKRIEESVDDVKERLNQVEAKGASSGGPVQHEVISLIDTMRDAIKNDLEATVETMRSDHAVRMSAIESRMSDLMVDITNIVSKMHSVKAESDLVVPETPRGKKNDKKKVLLE